jgi:hypothetical protein
MPDETPITERELRPLKAICIALPVGATLFAIVAIIIGSSGSPASVSDMQSEGYLTLRIIHLVITVFVLLLSKFISERILSGTLQQSMLRGMTLSFMTRYKIAAVVQLALIELSVLFGIVVFLTASIGGSIRTDLTYYLHLLPLLFFIFQARMLYPTEQKLTDLMRLHSAND